MASADNKGQQTINLEDLPIPQLQKLKAQFEEELDSLTQGYTQMKQAQASFRESRTCVQELSKPESREKTIMIPLTNSLYVPGKISNIDSVVVDVGTGYYIEKSINDATKFYDSKVEYVQDNAKKIQESIEKKQASYRGLLEIVQHKMSQQYHQQLEQQKKQGGKN